MSGSKVENLKSRIGRFASTFEWRPCFPQKHSQKSFLECEKRIDRCGV